MIVIAHILLLLSIFNLSLVLLIIRKANSSRASRLFALFLSFIAGWLFCTGMAIYPGMHREWVLLFIRAVLFFAVLVTISLLWFVAEFPFLVSRFRNFVWLSALSGAPLLVICWRDLIISSVSSPPWAAHAVAGKAIIYFSMWASVSLIFAIIHLGWKVKHTRGVIRLQLAYIFYGLLVPIVTGIIFNAIIPSLGYPSNYAFFGPISTIVMSISCTYAIMRYRMMEIRLVARFFLLHLISLPLMVFTVALFFQLIHKIIPAHDSDCILLYPLAGSILLAIIFQPIRKTVLFMLDKWIFRSEYDFGKVLLESGYNFVAAKTTPQVAEILQESIQKSLHPVSAALYLSDEENGLLRKITITNGASWPASIDLSTDIHSSLCDSDDVLLLEEFVTKDHPIDDGMMEMLDNAGVVMLAPLVSGNRLHGLLLIGERRTGEIYSVKDLNIVGIMSKQAVLALVNARHYELLLENNLQLEKSVQQRTSQLAEANTALEAEHAYLTSAIDILPVAIFIRSSEGDNYRYNRALNEFLLSHNANSIADTILLNPLNRNVIDQQHFPSYLALLGDIISAEEFLAVTPDSFETPILVHAGPIFIGGKIVASVVAFQDITALKAADRAKDEFLAILSHELRTPLTTILAWAEVGCREDDVSLKDKAFEIIIENSNRQRHLLNDLLDVTRIIHKTMLLQLQTVDLRNLAQRGIENVMLLATERQIALNFLTERDEILITVDEDRMMQVIDNILANALKFSEAGCTITIQLEKCTGEARLHISDNGRGISAESLSEIFIPFRQIGRLHSNGGLGLGLAIVKGIVELHHGNITVASPGIGQGSTFIVSLPLSKQV